MLVTDIHYYKLFEAIIFQACTDYRNALRGKDKLHVDNYTIEECRRFFKSGFCDIMDVDGEYILKKLDEEYKNGIDFQSNRSI